MAKRTKSSREWLAEHESDPYVKQARQMGYRSRAVFKLEEIQRAVQQASAPAATATTR